MNPIMRGNIVWHRITSQSRKLYWSALGLTKLAFYPEGDSTKISAHAAEKFLDHLNPYQLPWLDAFLQRSESLNYAEIPHLLWNLGFITKFTKAHSLWVYPYPHSFCIVFFFGGGRWFPGVGILCANATYEDGADKVFRRGGITPRKEYNTWNKAKGWNHINP